MVQVIQRPYPTFGEQIGTGLQEGMQRGADIGQLYVKSGITQKEKQADTAKRLAGLQRLKNTPYWEKASDSEKALLESEIMGDITGQSAKSLHNLYREQTAHQRIADLIGPQGNESSFQEPDSNLYDNLSQSQDRREQNQQDFSTTDGSNISKSKLQKIPDSKLRSMLADKTLAPIAQSELDRRKSDKETHSKIERANEPELLKLNDRLMNAEQTGMQYRRLNELFSPEFEKKFPPNILAALFTKEGDLNPIAFSQLSDEAQEAIKILSDQLSGAKNTFGARITNFDVAQYMKRLPSLLNSAKGRRQVLRDLQVINHINATHDKSILDIMDRNENKIPLSKAERLYREQNADFIKDMQDLYVHPNKKDFNSMPPPFLFSKGTRMEDENGQEFVNDGSEWILE